MNPESKLSVNFPELGEHRIFKEPNDETLGIQYRDFQPKVFGALSDQEKLDTLLTRGLICGIFEVDNLYQINTDTFENKSKKKDVYRKFIMKYGKMYGLEQNTFKDIEGKVQNALQEADLVINYFDNQETGLLRHMKSSLSITNEISAKKNPIDLALIMFSPEASQHLRYEARRKLLLMDLAFRSDIETKNHDKQIDNLLEFLNVNMWNGGIGVTDDIEIISTHSPVDYSCQNFTILDKDEKIIPSAYKRYTPFPMRRWTDSEGKQKHVYVEHRLKDPVARILKLLRKDTKDPSKIDDYLGLKFVFETKNEIYDFLLTLQKTVIKSGSMITFEEPYETIANSNDFRITNPGSSNKLEIIKCNVIFNGIRVEFQTHTFRTFLDYIYHDEHGFEIFAIKRLYEGKYDANGDPEPGVIDLIYAADIWGHNIRGSKDAIIEQRRSAVRNSAFVIPPERAMHGYSYESYPSDKFLADMIKIVSQLEEYPEQIVAVGVSGHFMAAQLSKLLGVVPIVQYNENLKGIKTGKKTLIVNGLTQDARRLKRIKKFIPDSKIAVIAERYPAETQNLVDYRVRTIQTNTWFNYYWEIPDIKISFPQGIALFYRINDTSGDIEILVEEMFNHHDINNLKLIRGKHEEEDEDLMSTVLRQLNEETGKRFRKQDFMPLASLTYELTSDENLNINEMALVKGFAQAFAHKVNNRFSLPVNKNTDSRYVWVSIDEFKKRSLSKSYTTCINTWTSQLQKIENLA